jgi:hyperosmotically inducible protein
MIPRLLLCLCVAALPVMAFPACASGTSSVRATGAAPAAMDDATVTARVKTVLLNDPQVNATKIDVSTAAGVVTLTGSVRSKAEEARAIELARQITGVRDVKSTLQVGPIPQF